mgnify:CR=1 FL=1
MKKDMTQRDEGNLYAVQELLEGLVEKTQEQMPNVPQMWNAEKNDSYKQMLKTVDKVIHNLSYGGYEF